MSLDATLFSIMLLSKIHNKYITYIYKIKSKLSNLKRSLYNNLNILNKSNY